MRKAICIVASPVALPAGAASANTSHEGGPRIDGMLLMNKTDAPRPLDARPGHNPFAGTDPRDSCDAIHKRGSCQRRLVRTRAGVVVTSRSGHNELLGGHGNDALYGGPWGDVRPRDHRLPRRQGPALRQPQGTAPLRDPRLRADLAQDPRPLTVAAPQGWLRPHDLRTISLRKARHESLLR